MGGKLSLTTTKRGDRQGVSNGERGGGHDRFWGSFNTGALDILKGTRQF